MDDYDFPTANEPFIPLYKEHWFWQLIVICMFCGAAIFVYHILVSRYNDNVCSKNNNPIYRKISDHIMFSIEALIGIYFASYYISILSDLNIHSVAAFFGIISFFGITNKKQN